MSYTFFPINDFSSHIAHIFYDFLRDCICLEKNTSAVPSYKTINELELKVKLDFLLSCRLKYHKQKKLWTCMFCAAHKFSDLPQKKDFKSQLIAEDSKEPFCV